MVKNPKRMASMMTSLPSSPAPRSIILVDLADRGEKRTFRFMKSFEYYNQDNLVFDQENAYDDITQPVKKSLEDILSYTQVLQLELISQSYNQQLYMIPA